MPPTAPRPSSGCSHPSSAIASTPSSSSRRSTCRSSNAWSTSCCSRSRRSSRRRACRILLDDAARRWLAEKGYDPKMGARPMARLMQEQIKRPLAEELLFGKLAAGGTVKIGVSADGKELKLDTLPTETPALPATLQ